MSFSPCSPPPALATPAWADQWADIQASKTMRCGTFADVPPFAAPDPKSREMVGFDVDMCRAIAKHLGGVLRPRSSRSPVEARVSGSADGPG